MKTKQKIALIAILSALCAPSFAQTQINKDDLFIDDQFDAIPYWDTQDFVYEVAKHATLGGGVGALAGGGAVPGAIAGGLYGAGNYIIDELAGKHDNACSNVCSINTDNKTDSNSDSNTDKKTDEDKD